MIGSQINQYKILEKIGSGGQGTVYKVLDTKLNRSAVIKVLPPELTQKTANFRRFEREGWVELPPPTDMQASGRVWDVRSGAAGRSADGRLYADW